jgi:hypothetical protein
MEGRNCRFNSILQGTILMTPNERIDRWQGYCEGDIRNGFLINGREGRCGVERIFDHKKLRGGFDSSKYVCDLLKSFSIETTNFWGHRFYFDENAKAYTQDEFYDIPWHDEIDYQTVIPLGEKFTSLGDWNREIIEKHYRKFGLPPCLILRGNIYFHRAGVSGRVLVPNDSTMNLCNFLINEYDYEDRRVQNG